MNQKKKQPPFRAAAAFLCRLELMLMVKRIMNVEQIVCAALEEIIIDISEGRVLLRDLELALVVRLEDGLAALRLAGVGGGRLSAALISQTRRRG